jgi:spoIIIJ-associated protein
VPENIQTKKYAVEELGPKIDGFLKATIAQGGFELTYEISEGDSSNPDIENPEVMVKFAGPDVELLLMNRAELLLALEHVTMEALRMPSEDHSRLSFDANDFRMLRISELRLSATAAAEKVKHSNEPFRFNPMNSRERRVIHIALRNELELRSESAGLGGYRHVIVYPAAMASLPEPPPPPRPDRRDRPNDSSRNDRRPFDSSRQGRPGRRPHQR